MLKLESIRTVLEYSNDYARIWLEICEDNPDICIFTHLLVDEKHRQQGFGTQALIDAEQIAKNHGCITIYIKVENNSWIYYWYLRLGYKFLTNAEDNYTWLTRNI